MRLLRANSSNPLRHARLWRITLVTLALLILSTALSAYTVYLKDGSQLIAREKYTVSNGRAIIILSTGTKTSIDLAEIDVPRTDRENTVDYGGVVVLQDNSVQTIPTSQGTQERQTLAQMIQPGGRDRLEPTSGPRAGETPDNESPRRDLTRAPRTPYSAVDIGNQLQQLMRSRGIETIKLYQGTERRHILVDIVTNSEASVFRALEASAKALVTLSAQRPDEIEAFELLMVTDRQGRAGQFLMTPERAAELVSSKLTPQQFFLQYVEY